MEPAVPFGIAGGIGRLVFLIVVAVIVAAALPKQMAAVKEQLNERFFPSLGWGALTAFVIVPALVLILVISIIGIIPLIFVVAPALFLVGSFAVVCVVGAIGDRVMAQSGSRDNAMLVAVVGVVILGVAGLIPVAGAIIMAVAGVVGLGATLLAISKAQRDAPRAHRSRQPRRRRRPERDLIGRRRGRAARPEGLAARPRRVCARRVGPPASSRRAARALRGRLVPAPNGQTTRPGGLPSGGRDPLPPEWVSASSSRVTRAGRMPRNVLQTGSDFLPQLTPKFPRRGDSRRLVSP